MQCLASVHVFCPVLRKYICRSEALVYSTGTGTYLPDIATNLRLKNFFYRMFHHICKRVLVLGKYVRFYNFTSSSQDPAYLLTHDKTIHNPSGSIALVTDYRFNAIARASFFYLDVVNLMSVSLSMLRPTTSRLTSLPSSTVIRPSSVYVSRLDVSTSRIARIYGI